MFCEAFDFRNVKDHKHKQSGLETFETIKKTLKMILILNDIIKLINRSLGIQVMLLSFQYLVLGIFVIFGIFHASFAIGHDLKFSLKWYIYFIAATHTMTMLTSLISTSIQREV